MNHKRVKALTNTEIAKLTTPRLRAYRKKLLELENSAELSDLNRTELANLDSEYLYFKDTPEWSNLNSSIVALMNNRE